MVSQGGEGHWVAFITLKIIFSSVGSALTGQSYLSVELDIWSTFQSPLRITQWIVAQIDPPRLAHLWSRCSKPFFQVLRKNCCSRPFFQNLLEDKEIIAVMTIRTLLSPEKLLFQARLPSPPEKWLFQALLPIPGKLIVCYEVTLAGWRDYRHWNYCSIVSCRVLRGSC